MRRISGLLSIVLIVALCSCAGQEKSENVSLEPPIEDIQWGMSPEEVTEVLSMPQERENSNDKLVTFIYEDREVFGHAADIEMIFDVQTNMGLLEMYVRYDDISEDDVRQMLTKMYGACATVDNEGKASQWESMTIEELSENMQERFQTANVEYPAKLINKADDFSQETIWNTLKKSPLVQVSLGEDVIYYNAHYMAAYSLYQDDASYEAYLRLFDIEK